MLIREKQVEQALVSCVSKAGGLALKFTCPGRVGVPDRIVILQGGEQFFVECKSPTGVVSSSQSREHDRLRALGCRVLVLNKVISDISELTGW